MRNLKKLGVFFMSGTMIMSMATGVSAASEEAISGDLKMIFWDTTQEDSLRDMAEGFMAKYPDCNVTVETWGEYWVKLQAAAQGGGMPDIIVMHPDEVENYVEGGMLMDLSDVLSGDIANASNFPQYVVDDFKVGDSYYGIPKDIGTMGLYYNKDLFDAANVEYPTADWTWDDFMSAAEKITDTENGIYGMLSSTRGPDFWWQLVWQNGGEVYDPVKNICTLDTPEAIEAVEYAVSFIEKGYSPTPADAANLSEMDMFRSGKLGMLYGGSWTLQQYLDAETLNFGVAEVPQGKQKSVLCSGMAFTVASATKNPEAAVKLVEYLGSEEAQLIEAKAGAAIPAYNGTQTPWIENFTTVDASAFVDCIDYGHVSGGLTTNTSDAATIIDDYMLQIFSLERPVEETMKEMTEMVNASLQ